MGKMYDVTNRSGSNLFYSINEDNLHREFTPGETKRISYEELEKLSYKPAGKRILSDYLMIRDAEVLENLSIHTEPEYNMDANAVKTLLETGSLDALLDALDFAPEGVVELIKDIAVRIQVNDVAKRQAIKDKTGFNVDAAIRHIQEEKTAAAQGESSETEKKRRVQPEEKSAGRRTAPTYNVVNKKE